MGQEYNISSFENVGRVMMKANFEAIILKISEILTVFKAMINTDEKDFLS